MIVPLQKLAFFLLFAVFQVLLIIFYATSYEIIIIAGYIIFLLFYYRKLKLSVVTPTTTLALFLFSFIATSISFFFSHSLPISIGYLAQYGALLLTFTFFHVAFVEKKIINEHLFLTILVVVFSVSFLFIFSFLSADIASVLAPLNLITLAYGHSHFAAILLLGIPIAWWFYYSKYSSYFKYKHFLLLFFYCLLIVTFGRLAILLSLMALPFLIKRGFFKVRYKKMLYAVFGLFIFLFILFVSFGNNMFCSSGELKQQLCKPITHEVRPEYFKLAIQGFIRNPITGYGPGTYSLITKKYSVVAKNSSSFAHNFFLQVFAESGFLVGIGVVLLFSSFFIQALRIMGAEESKRGLEYYLAVGFILIFLNSLFDFDWNVFYTLHLSLIFVAGFMKGDLQENIYYKKIFTIVWYMIALGIISLGICTLLARVLAIDKQYDLAVRVFPYYTQSVSLMRNGKLSQKTMNRLYALHRNDPDFVAEYIAQIKDEKEQISLYQHLTTISPWTQISPHYLQLLKNHSRYQELGVTALNGIDLIETASKSGYVMRHQTKEELGDFLMISANYHLHNGDSSLAGQYYKTLLGIEKWTMHLNTPTFITDEGLTLQQVSIFLKESNATHQVFGKNRQLVVAWFMQRVSKDIDLLDPSDFGAYMEFFSRDELWVMISEPLYSTIITTENLDERKQLILQWFYIWEYYVATVNDSLHLTEEYRYELISSLSSIGESEKAKQVWLFSKQ